MQLIEFETRLEKGEEQETHSFPHHPYAFKTYAKVSLNLKDVKGIELIRTQLSTEFLESIDWEEGTAFFEPFYLDRTSHRFRKDETIHAMMRLSNEFNDIFYKYREYSDNHKKENLLSEFYSNRFWLKEEMDQVIDTIKTRTRVVQNCISTLSSDECKLLEIKDCYPENIGGQIYDLVYTERDSACTDGEVIASLESAYSQGID